MYHNRASYQKINPNMSTKATPKKRTPILVFTARGNYLKDGETATSLIKPCDIKTLRTIAVNRQSPIKVSDVLLSLVNGETIQVNSFNVTLSFR